MTLNTNALSFLQDVMGYNQAQHPKTSADKGIKLAVIDSAYVSSSFAAGTLPRVTFEGESTLSTKFYPVLGPYWPQPSDRVAMVPIGTTWLIIGPVSTADGGVWTPGNAHVGGNLDVTGTITSSILPTAPVITSFTSSGTWTKPANLLYVSVWCVGGGGGSGGASTTAAGQSAMGGGGGGGATAYAVIAASLLASSVTVTVGNGGTAATSTAGNTAGTGGTSSFGALLTANGGIGGVTRAASAVPHGINGGSGSATIGGTATNKILHSGGTGGTGWGSDNGLGISGHGGDSHMGGGADGRRTTASGQSLGGFTGSLYGGGASGSVISGSTTGIAGAVGGKGGVFVEEHYEPYNF